MDGFIFLVFFFLPDLVAIYGTPGSSRNRLARQRKAVYPYLYRSRRCRAADDAVDRIDNRRQSCGPVDPSLRGSRSGYGRDSRSFSTSTRATTGGGSTSSGGGSSSGGSTASMSSGSSGAQSTGATGDSAGTVASSSGNTSSGLNASRGASAMRAATSRVSSSRTTTNRSSTSSSAASSSVMGSDGLGSSAGSLPGGGGGGRGGGGGGGRYACPSGCGQARFSCSKGNMVAEFDRQYMVTRLDDYKASLIQTDANFKNSKPS